MQKPTLFVKRLLLWVWNRVTHSFKLAQILDPTVRTVSLRVPVVKEPIPRLPQGCGKLFAKRTTRYIRSRTTPSETCQGLIFEKYHAGSRIFSRRIKYRILR